MALAYNYKPHAIYLSIFINISLYKCMYILQATVQSGDRHKYCTPVTGGPEEGEEPVLLRDELSSV